MKLTDPVSSVPLVGPSYVKKLKKLEINSVMDLLYHIPSRYVDFTNTQQISELKIGEQTTIEGQIVSMQNIRTKTGKVMQIAKISDGSATVEATWMNQPYIVQMLPLGTIVSLSGKLSFWGKKKVFSFPQYEKVMSGKDTVHTGRLIPIYPETAQVSSKWLRSRIHTVLQLIEPQELEDFLSQSEREKLKLLPLEDAIRKIHEPENQEDATRARQRLAFDELLMLNIENSLEKIKWRQENKSITMHVSENDIKKFLDNLPFKLTSSQQRSLNELVQDMNGEFPMNRLLEGDVGSGKTVIAAAGAYISSKNKYQTVLMAPTQILATQHFETLNAILKPFNISVDLIVGGSKRKNSDFKADVVVGTHALLHRNIFKNVGLVVVDEQHRFGVKQRAKISEQREDNTHPHVLTMTATPIPRTVALTLYGDLELSTLDELPKGRQPITTWLVPPQKRDGAYKWIEDQINKELIQAFIVCPLIEESETETMKGVRSAKAEFERLQKVFKKQKLGLLHGRMKNDEKQEILDKFRSGELNILVSTPVVEVGIDIPNATIMMIEASDRFGLAQLHQLRGRVGRGHKKSYCLLFTDSKTQKVLSRLKSMTEVKTGRELAEIDLKTRGPGEVFGIKQHGYSELKIADWTDIGLIKKTKQFADEVVQNQSDHENILTYYKTKQISAN